MGKATKAKPPVTMSDEALQDGQAEIADLKGINLSHIGDALDNAEGCETAGDFVANVEDALQALETLKLELIELLPAERRGWFS